MVHLMLQTPIQVQGPSQAQIDAIRNAYIAEMIKRPPYIQFYTHMKMLDLVVVAAFDPRTGRLEPAVNLFRTSLAELELRLAGKGYRAIQLAMPVPSEL